MATVPLVPLVGRDRELALLRTRLSSALVGNGSLVLIGGEAGIGKTALAETICQQVAQHGALVLVGRCYDLTETPPYGVWIDLFQHWQTDANSLPLPSAFAERGTVGAVASQPVLFQQVLDFFIALSTARPLVLLLDDLHWSDPASLDLLRAVARALTDAPILLIATYRADELTRRHPLYALLPMFVRESKAVRVDLHPLDADALHTLVTTDYALSTADAARLVAYLGDRAEGNPLFTGELLRTLEESRVLRRGREGWFLDNISQTPVPTLLKQVIDGRVARLGDGVQLLLEMGAVIGQEIPLSLWAGIADTTEESLLTAVEPARVGALLAEVPGGAAHRFTHALIREALYEGIAPAQLRRLHRRIGETLVAASSPDPDAVAYHFRQAGDERAAVWLVRAGERAQRAYAWLTAVERYEVAARLMEAAGADAGERGWLMHRIAVLLRHADPRRALATLNEVARLAAQAGDRGLAIHLLHTRGWIRCVIGDHRRGLADLAASVEGTDTLAADDYTRLRARLATESIPLDRHHGRGTLAIRLTRVGRYVEARAIAERVVADAPPPGEVIERGGSHIGDAYNALIEIYGAFGLPDRAAWAFTQAVATFRAAEHYLSISGSSSNALRWLLLAYRTDDIAERQRVAAGAREALQRASGTGGTSSTLFSALPCLFVEGNWPEINAATPALLRSLFADFAWIDIGPLARAQGDTDQAWTYVRAKFPHGPATEPGETEFMPAVAMQRLAAALALDAGNHDTARAWLEAHDRWLKWGGVVLGQSEGQALWAAYYRAIGDRKQALTHADQALASGSEPRQPLALLAAHRLLGELATDAGRFDAARAHVQTALALADACAAPYERAVTLLVHAALCLATNDRAAARSLITEVRALCTPLGAQPVLERAEALDARLADMHEMPSANPAGLSAREVEVLRLIAAGRTNREIADALFLSYGTVNIHVTHILTKTNTTNRTEAAAFAMRHGLT